MSSKSTKQARIDALLLEFRTSGNLDTAFDALAARRLDVNMTDLHCLNIIESRSGLTAGELASEAGLTSGAVTGVIDRLERAGYVRRVGDPYDRRKVKV
jgi:DNA-binding MarR family transcriptional regulator